MKDIWSLQPRLEQRSGKRPFALLEHEQFRAGFDFLLIRAQSGECDRELGGWWERFQHASPDDRQAMLVAPSGTEKRPRRRRRRGPRTDGDGNAPSDSGTSASS